MNNTKFCLHCNDNFETPGSHWRDNRGHFECKDRAKQLRRNKQILKNIEIYGVPNPKDTKEYHELIRTKRENTLFEKYGTVNPMHVDEIKEKVCLTNIKRYGYSTPAKSEIVKKRIKKTNIEKYGVDSTLSLPHVKESRMKGRKDKYIYLSDGQSLADYCRENGLSKAWAYKVYKYRGEVGLKEWADGYEKRITLPELYFIDIMAPDMNLTLFDKKPEGFDVKVKPDFKISDDLYVNVDGLVWHSEKKQENGKYHLELREKFKRNNTRIIQLRADEVLNNPQICKSIVMNSAGLLCKKIHARKCEVRAVGKKEVDEFFNKNHLMGATKATTNFGLYYKGELMSCMSIRNYGGEVEISRFANLLFTRVNGGFSKLLNHIEKIYNPIIIKSYCDLRYSTGESYTKNGFEKVSTSLGWKWTDHRFTYNRLYCKANMDERGLAEAEYAIEMKLFRIYDAGQALYIKNL